MRIKLRSSRADIEALYEQANSRAKTVKVNREALLNLLIDRALMRDTFAPAELVDPAED